MLATRRGVVPPPVGPGPPSQGVLSVTVIAVIRSELWFSSGVWWNGWWYTSTSSVCYMTTGEVSANICTYGYWVGAIGIFCAFFLFFTGFTKLRPGYRTRRVFEVLLVGFGIVWWLPFAITATVYGKQANNVDLPYKHWRNVVIGLAWGIFVTYTVQLVVVLLDWKTYPKQPEMPHGRLTEGVDDVGWAAVQRHRTKIKLI